MTDCAPKWPPMWDKKKKITPMTSRGTALLTQKLELCLNLEMVDFCLRFRLTRASNQPSDQGPGEGQSRAGPAVQ